MKKWKNEKLNFYIIQINKQFLKYYTNKIKAILTDSKIPCTLSHIANRLPFMPRFIFLFKVAAQTLLHLFIFIKVLT
jgi:hypothetical protein